MTFKELHGKFALLERKVLKLKADAKRGKRREKQKDAQIEKLTLALEAASQFIVVGVDRGPTINGWENTIAIVQEALGRSIDE